MTNNAERPAGPVLVTGAAGFIGQHLVRRLVQEGIPVRALVLPHETPCTLFPELLSAIEVIRGDVTNPYQMAMAIQGCSHVYHLAAVVGDWGGEALHQRVTVGGTGVVLRAASTRDVHVILASSIVFYGDRLGEDECCEEHPGGNPLGPYSRAKQMQEAMAAYFSAHAGCRVTIVRPANVYGPGSQPWVHSVVEQLRLGRPCLIGDGNLNAGLAHVEHVVDILFRASRPAAIRRIYNACDCSAVTWNQYFREMAKIAGSPAPKSVSLPVARSAARAGEWLWGKLGVQSRPPLTREALNLVGSSHRVPVSRAAKELGFQPFVRHADAMQEIGGYIQQHLPK